MCRNTILRFVLWYFYLYTQVIVLANRVDLRNKLLLAIIFVGEMLRKNVMYEIFYCIKAL